MPALLRPKTVSKPLTQYLALVATTLAFLNGCATVPKDYPINGEAAPTINRDTNGKSLSIVVRLYQLKEKNEFNRLTFDTAASGKPDQELFGQEFVSRTEVVLVPGGKQTITDKLQPETRFVGVVGFFRKPDGQAWRFLVDADAVRSKGLNFRVQDCYLQITTPDPVAIPGQAPNWKPDCGPQPTTTKPVVTKR
ncbi:type VI secretion system lipoprotein TssJ [Andreprevotia chitinilytica]|uniref:type VI secretion system lipoprotein TssJ n=1 Tax=Andreprevotia chitinilytica TaxID=396808 RepID=UPI000A069C6D|nr:type VI secretion system lipoprotein TssJ [Andreprevotia chitinilytica]